MAEIKVTMDNFDSEVMNADIPVLVDFWASWCGPCKMLGPVIAELAEELAGKVKVAKINVDDEPGLAARYGIASIPTVILFKNGEIAAKSIGFKDKAALMAMINGYCIG